MATKKDYYEPSTIVDYDSSVGTWKSQSFTTTSAYTISKITVRLKKLSDSDGHTWTVGLYENSGDLPGTLLATFGTFNENTYLTTSYANYDFSDDSYVVSDATKYVIGIKTTETLTTTEFSWATSTNSGYANGRRGKGNSSTDWILDEEENDCWFRTWAEDTSYVDLTGTIAGISSLSGALTTETRLCPPGVTYWYDDGSFYYRLIVQSDGSYGSPPPDGIEDTDYEILDGYLPNFINTNRRLVAATRNSIYYENI